MVKEDILEEIKGFFHAYRLERDKILQRNFTETLNDLAARRIHGSITGNKISKLYADELITRTDIAWKSIQRLFEKRTITFSKNDADEIREEIKKLINSERDSISNNLQSKLNNMRLNHFKKEIDQSLGAARNQAISKINAELSTYVDPDFSGDNAFDGILLEPVQEELLINIVEAARNTPLHKRAKFFVHQSFDGDTLNYPTLAKEKTRIYFGDIEALAHENLLSLGYGSQGTPSFDVTPLGFKYYEYVKKKLGEPVERIVKTVRRYLDSSNFVKAYPAAYQNWRSAEELLWKTDSIRQSTLIGHLCRESIQEFADYLVSTHNLSNTPPDKSKTVARLKAVIESKADSLGDTKKHFLNALIQYWGTVIDLVQRQEHGSQKEGKPLVWEDARAVVFQTLIVMFEIDRNL